MIQHDPVQSPLHYRGSSGIQSIEITHAYRLGPDLTQAVDYILRAGRKTADPRQDLAKAAFYLRHAARHARDLTFGVPDTPRPTPAEIAADFGVDGLRAEAIALVMRPQPCPDDCVAAAIKIDLAIETVTAGMLPVANSGRAA